MALAPDFKLAAYHINRVLNGLSHQWCDGDEQDVAAFRKDLDALRGTLLPFLCAANAPLGRALADALQAVDDGKAQKNEIVSEALARIGSQLPQIAAYRVDFGDYCSALSENKGRAYVGKPPRDPNLRAA